MGFYNLHTTDNEIWARRPAWDRRRERLRAAQRLGRHTSEEWNQKIQTTGYCAGCGRSDVRLEKDHIIPISRYGCDCISNIQPMCGPCNSSKGAK